VQFDVLYLPTYVPELDGDYASFYGRMLEQIGWADELGFTTVWLTEHHFAPYGGTLPNPAVLGAAIAARTRRIRIGTAVTVLPLHNPLLVAEDFAMLDVLSGGRFDFGIGRGSVQVEFEEFGIDYQNSAAVMLEATDLILAAWRCEPLEHRGAHFAFSRPIDLLPKPVQQPHPPVWVGASRTPETFAWAGSRGFNLMVLPYMMPPADLLDRLEIYRQAARQAGHDPDQLKIMGKFHVLVADTAAEATRLARPAYDHYQGLSGARSSHGPRTYWRDGSDWDKHLAEYRVIGGTPEQCIEGLTYWQNTLNLTQIGGTFHFGGLDQQATLRSLELFAQEVAPHFTSSAPDTRNTALDASVGAPWPS
jgi:natural product biosynthesis luciferase-like monooxygenase protein